MAEEENKTAAEQMPEQEPQQEPQAEALDEPGHENIDELKRELEAAHQEIEQLREQALRTAAEAQNVRRRSEMEVDKARKFALERFSGDLLAVVDNLERALQSVDADNEAVKPLAEGVELTYRSFIDTLARHNVQQLDPQGEPFDPQLHEAVTAVPNPALEPNTVMDVMQKGYTLNERLLRAAMVVVSKGE